MSALLPVKIDSYESCSPKTDARMTRLLKGLACSTAEVLGDCTSGVRAIRIGNNEEVLPGMVAGDTIYERSFYPRLVNIICSTGPRVILLSNPGTGKSLFQFYLLTRFANPALFAGDGGDAQLPTDKKKFGSAFPPKVVVREVLGGSIEVWFLEQQIVQKINSLKNSVADVLCCFDPTTMLYFFEPMKTTRIEPYANEFRGQLSTLATVPPDSSNYHQFSKVASTKYMPVFTELELLAIGRDMRTRPGFDSSLDMLYTDDAIRDRFKTFNGIIRYVLPQWGGSCLTSAVKSFVSAARNIDPARIQAIMHKDVTHLAFMYDVDKVKFSMKGVFVVNDKVLEDLTARFKDKPLLERMSALLQFSSFSSFSRGLDCDSVYGVPSAFFETVVVDHLTSASGVHWHMRDCSASAGGGTGKKTKKSKTESEKDAADFDSSLPWVPMRLQLGRVVAGKVPKYADMVPKVLYTSLACTFPFCDMVYKDEEEGKLVCIRVCLEGDGQRDVTVGAFEEFCERMGWGKSPSEDLLDRISYVFVPEPRLADTAEVVFEDGVGLKSHTIWRVSANYSSGN